MKIYIVILLSLLTLLSCRKEELDQFDGPSLDDVYGEFGIVEGLAVSSPTVDFSTGAQVHFTCKLSKLSAWKLTITGETSGAVKIIEGVSNSLDESNATWDGSTTEFPMFNAENCLVNLTFEGEPDTLSTETSVEGLKQIEGFVVADFESGWNNGWSKFVQSGGNMKFEIVTDEGAPQLNSHYNMQGIVDWDWLIGLVDFNAAAYGENTLELSDNADNLYFNVLVYGEEGLDNSLILFRFDEDENGDGNYDAASDDQFGYEVTIDWVGWKLISVKYSDLEGNNAGGGVHNPNLINKVSVLHLANPSSGFAKTAIDLLIFTENEPLRP